MVLLLISRASCARPFNGFRVLDPFSSLQLFATSRVLFWSFSQGIVTTIASARATSCAATACAQKTDSFKWATKRGIAALSHTEQCWRVRTKGAELWNISYDLNRNSFILPFLKYFIQLSWINWYMKGTRKTLENPRSPVIHPAIQTYGPELIPFW